jgi:hypothetical protein
MLIPAKLVTALTEAICARERRKNRLKETIS